MTTAPKKQEATGNPLCLVIYRSNNPTGYQIAIEDKTGGYRLAGPKFNGQSQLLQSRELGERDAEEIRVYLERRFPTGFRDMHAKAAAYDSLKASHDALVEALTSALRRLELLKASGAMSVTEEIEQARSALSKPEEDK